VARVAVIGPGALGCLFAARFALADMDVCLIDHDENRAARLLKQGILVETEGAIMKAHPQVVTSYSEVPDLILVLTKSHATPSISLPPEAPVLTLQNGLGNAECLAARCGGSRILAGATSEAAHLLAPGHVCHAARGITTFGAWEGCNTHMALELLQRAGFEAVLTSTPRWTLWWKAVISAAVNPLTALLNVPNGALLENPESRSLLHGLAGEAILTAQMDGIYFKEDMLETVETVCRATGTNISSMLQDIRNGKQTEIDAISGEILRRAGAAELHLPQTQVAYRLISALESLHT